jgi:hypothetical protein
MPHGQPGGGARPPVSLRITASRLAAHPQPRRTSARRHGAPFFPQFLLPNGQRAYNRPEFRQHTAAGEADIYPLETDEAETSIQETNQFRWLGLAALLFLALAGGWCWIRLRKVPPSDSTT